MNALQATLVEYESKGTNVTVNGATVAIGASKPTFVTSSIAGAATSINDTIDNTTHDYTVEFARSISPTWSWTAIPTPSAVPLTPGAGRARRSAPMWTMT